jgi:peptide/nickel transport system ATP-binding protein
MTEIYRAEHITKTFGHGKNEVQAVKDVTFGLEQGEVTTIVGESGSGKSTIARMVLGLMPITAGKLIFDGKDVTNLKGRARTEGTGEMCRRCSRTRSRRSISSSLWANSSTAP